MSCPPENTDTRRLQLEAVIKVVDWITPTPQISHDLLPLLAYMSKLSNRAVGIVQPKPFGPVPNQTLSASQLSNDTIAKVTASSTIDQALYDFALQRYDFSRMRVYLGQMGALEAV
jgi:hypothetical protein